ncbi:unnamed protein product, partial [Mesorhabditis spiculigera]
MVAGTVFLLTHADQPACAGTRWVRAVSSTCGVLRTCFGRSRRCTAPDHLSWVAGSLCAWPCTGSIDPRPSRRGGGAEHVTAPLSTALDTGRINHAYLFSGPRGCGKTSSARILARSLNCEQGPTSTPCDVCDSCVSLGPGGTGQPGRDGTRRRKSQWRRRHRELRDKAFHAPAASRYRVFIIDDGARGDGGGLQRAAQDRRRAAGAPHLHLCDDGTGKGFSRPSVRVHTHYPFRLLAPSTMRGLLERSAPRKAYRSSLLFIPGHQGWRRFASRLVECHSISCSREPARRVSRIRRRSLFSESPTSRSSTKQ